MRGRGGLGAAAALYAAALALGLAEELSPGLRSAIPAPAAYRPALYALGLVGSVEVVWAAVLAYSAYVYLRRRGLPVALLASLLLAEAIDGVLKVSFSICRPLEASCPLHEPLLVDSYSYPSGHASRTFSLPLNLRGIYRWLLLALAAAIAVSRVLIEAHYPLDVIGGAALGLASSLVAGPLVERLGLKELEPGLRQRVEQRPGYPELEPLPSEPALPALPLHRVAPDLALEVHPHEDRALRPHGGRQVGRPVAVRETAVDRRVGQRDHLARREEPAQRPRGPQRPRHVVPVGEHDDGRAPPRRPEHRPRVAVQVRH
ncbi:MAG: phosphatase PAP2 family protein [Nitrososphaeria archaeon]|jgi:membrane-associated phospholipid phosphatase